MPRSPWPSRSPRPHSARCCRSSRTPACSATPFGGAVLNHGAFGELGPVVAMAVLLSARRPGLSILVLAVFAALAVVMTLPWTRLQHGTTRVMQLIRPARRRPGRPRSGSPCCSWSPCSCSPAAFSPRRGARRVRGRVHPAPGSPGGRRAARAQARRAGVRAAHPGLLRDLRDGDRPGRGRRQPSCSIAFVGHRGRARRPDLRRDGRSGAPDGPGEQFDRRGTACASALYGSTGLPIIVAVTTSRSRTAR